jgi:hypothetical protein
MYKSLLCTTFLVWRLVNSQLPTAPFVKCLEGHERKCGSSFSNCNTKLEYRCVTNVEFLGGPPELTMQKIREENAPTDHTDFNLIP